MSANDEDLIQQSYEAFNSRDVDSALAAMHPAVDWPDMLEGRRIVGHDAVRAYWLSQFESIDPHVEPLGFTTHEDGTIAVAVRQVVTTTEGEPLDDRVVEHVYSFRDGLVAAMDVYVGGELASAPRTATSSPSPSLPRLKR